MSKIWCGSYTCLAENEEVDGFLKGDNMKIELSDLWKKDMKL